MRDHLPFKSSAAFCYCCGRTEGSCFALKCLARDRGRRCHRSVAALGARNLVKPRLSDRAARHFERQPLGRFHHRRSDECCGFAGFPACFSPFSRHRLSRRPDHLLDLLGRDDYLTIAGALRLGPGGDTHACRRLVVHDHAGSLPHPGAPGRIKCTKNQFGRTTT